MLKRQGEACPEVLHSTGLWLESPLSPPVFSADRSLLPLAQWTDVELDSFFDGLILLVLHEGRVH